MSSSEMKASLQKQIRLLNERITELEKKSKTKDKRIKELESEAKSITKNAASQVRSRLRGMDVKLKNHFQAEMDLREQVDTFLKQMKSLESKLKTLQLGKEKVQEELQQSTDETKKLKEEKKSLVDRTGLLETSLLDNMSKNSLLETKLLEVEKKEAAMESKLNGAKNVVEFLEKQLEHEMRRNLGFRRGVIKKKIAPRIHLLPDNKHYSTTVSTTSIGRPVLHSENGRLSRAGKWKCDR